jgi:hypothetical protein
MFPDSLIQPNKPAAPAFKSHMHHDYQSYTLKTINWLNKDAEMSISVVQYHSPILKSNHTDSNYVLDDISEDRYGILIYKDGAFRSLGLFASWEAMHYFMLGFMEHCHESSR